MELLWPAQPRARVERVLVGLACLLLVIALYQVARRVVFPWDLYIWSESPFMTNMLKITSGESAFDKPEDANSWVYAPGLEYLCFAILRPLGLSLDVRACRVIVVALGLLAAWAGMRASTRLYRLFDERPSEEPPLVYRAFAFATMAILVLRNFTSDVCHPDNAFAAHAMVTLLLCLRAFEVPTLRRLLGACAFSALGIAFKQTAAFGFVGVAALFFVFGRRRWSLGARLAGVGLGAVIEGGIVAAFMSHPNSKFFLFELLAKHGAGSYRFADMMRACFTYPHFALSIALLCFAVLRVVTLPRDGVVLVVWLALGAETLASIASYLKVMGAWNNLGIVCLWGFVVTLPVLWRTLSETAAQKAFAPMALAAGSLLLLLCAMIPLKQPPTPAQYAYGENLEARIRADVREGRRVLLPHGTMPLVRAGMKDIPFDRSNTVLELNMALLPDVAKTKWRIEHHHYDRIYMLAADFYGAPACNAIQKHFREVEVLPGDQTPAFLDDYLSGYQNFMRAPLRVMEWAGDGYEAPDRPYACDVP